MKYLFLFESFIEKLNEIEFGAHWKERSSLPGEENSRLSRIQPQSREFPEGWRIQNLLDNKRQEIDVNEFLKDTPMDEEKMKKSVSYALRELTRNEKLRNYVPEGDKKVVMLGLGRLGIFNGERTAFPCLSTYDPAKNSWYPGGDGIWGVADRNKGITFYYLPFTSKGAESFYNSTRHGFKMSDLEFLENSSLVYPQGEKFTLVIDATDPSLDSIKNKIVKQILGQPIEYGPEPERDIVTIRKVEPTRKTISPGDEIEYVVKFIDGQKFLKGKILEIINMGDIKKGQRTKSLSGIQDIKVKFLPYEPEKGNMSDDDYKKEQEKYKRTGSGEILPVTISLKDGSVLISDGVKYKILGPSNGKPLITSEPSIINAGNVQTWVEELPTQG